MNPATVKDLVDRFGVVVRDHYRDNPVDRDRVLELLNGFAVSTAIVLAGTGGDQAAVEFYLEALEVQLSTLLAAPAEEAGRPN